MDMYGDKDIFLPRTVMVCPQVSGSIRQILNTRYKNIRYNSIL